MRTINVPLQVPTGSTEAGAAHASPQTTVAFSPCGRSYATGGYDGRVVLWDRESETARWTRQHDRLVNSIRFSPSGRLLASGGADKVGRVWDVEGGGLVQVFARQPDDLNSVAWIDDSRLVAVSQDGTGRIWNIADGTLSEVSLVHTDHCMSVDASVNGAIATCGEDSTIRIWEPSGKPRKVLDQAGHAEMCCWSPDGRHLAASCDDGYVHVLDDDGALITKLGPYETAVKSVAWSGDSRHMAVGAYDRTVRVWDVASGQECVRWQGPHFWPRSLDWSSDGRTILVGTVAAEPALLAVPELKPADDPQTVTVAPGSATRGVNHLAAAGLLLVSGSDDGRVSIWRSSAFEFGTAVGDGALVNAVSIAPVEPHLVAYGTFGGRIGVLGWHSSQAEAVASIQGLHPVNRVVWSPDGARLATADYEGLLRIYFWDGMSLTEHARYSGHHGAIKDICWIAEDRLVTISTDRTAHLVSADGKRLREFTGHGELVNAGSATTVAGTAVLATASRDRTIRLYDLESAALLNVLVGHDESVKAVAWKPGSAVLLSGGYDFDAKVWRLDPRTWQLVSVETLSAHTNAVSCVAWYGDDPVTGSWDGRILVWQAGGNGARLEARDLHRAPAARIGAGDRD